MDWITAKGAKTLATMPEVMRDIYKASRDGETSLRVYDHIGWVYENLRELEHHGYSIDKVYDASDSELLCYTIDWSGS